MGEKDGADKPLIKETKKDRKTAKEKDNESDQSEDTKYYCRGIMWASICIGILLVIFIIVMFLMGNEKKQVNSGIKAPKI